MVAERFFDEAGGMQLVIHAPFGGRINRAWGMALRKRFCRSFNFELQAAATDDGVLLSLGPQHSFPLETVFGMVHPAGLEELLTQAALQAPMFGRAGAGTRAARWRCCAGRWPARVPPYLQRMRAEDLLVAVFPAQLACQDNIGAGPIEIPDHPLVTETLRDCLTEAMDVEGLRGRLEALHAGRIRCVTRETPEPSVFAHEILNANPYTFLDDAPLEERRARAVTLRRGLPASVAEDMGRLDPGRHRRGGGGGAARSPERGRAPRSAPGRWARCRRRMPSRRGASSWTTLVDARRAACLRGAGRVFWVAAERRSLAQAVWPRYQIEPDVAEPPARRAAAWSEREGALVEVVRARLALTGPITAPALAEALDVTPGEMESALAAIEAEGGVLRGRFTSSANAIANRDVEWCDRRLLARIHRRTLDGLRRLIEPVPAAALIRFLFAWQHARPGTQLHGRDGLLRVLERLQGFEAAAGAWERELLPARMQRYELDLAGRAVPVRRGDVGAPGPARERAPRGAPAVAHRAGGAAPAPRSRLAARAPRRRACRAASPPAPRATCSRICARSGASFVDEIAEGVRRLRIEVEEALCELVTAGQVTGDGFAGLRGLMHSEKRQRARPGRAPRRPALAGHRPLGAARAARGAARGRSHRGQGASVRAPLRRGVPRSPAARVRRARVARSAPRLSPARDAGRAARRPHRGRLRGRAVRRPRGPGGPARHST